MILESFRNIFAIPDLRKRVLFTFGLLAVYRIGCIIPSPGVDPRALLEFMQAAQSGFLGFVNTFTGGSLERVAVFAMGIMPYITSSIILQLLTVVVPYLEKLSKEGEMGRRKITQYTRYATIAVALVQSFGVAVFLQKTQTPGGAPLVLDPGVGFILTTMLTLTTGCVFVMWLGEQITERGVGNGISMLILAGIVAGLPGAVGSTVSQVASGEMQGPFALLLIIIVLGTTAFVVFVERAQRRIAVNYAKRQVGRKMYAGQTSHLPFKLNMSGVIPPIFASSIILFPATMASWFGTNEQMTWLKDLSAALSPGQTLYIVLYASAIIFFCFFYTALVFNSKETADNLKKSGAFVPGIRPGEQTARYIDKVITRLTLVGAIYITLVCLLPEFLHTQYNVPFYFGGTSLLIVVVVTMDFMSQLQAYLMSHQYESLLKKANFKGSGFPVR